MLTISQEALKGALNICAPITATRAIQPVLACVKIKPCVKTQEVSFQATDLDFWAETKAKVEMVEEFPAFCISGKKLAEIVGSLPPKKDVVFQFEKEGQVGIKCGRSSFSLPMIAGEDYPDFPDLSPGVRISLAGGDFIDAAQKTAFATADYDTNNVLSCVLTKIGPKGLELVSTDGSRLARVTNQRPIDTEDETQAIIPGKALQRVCKLIKNASSRVIVQHWNGQMSFTTDSVHVMTRLADGTYPKYEQLIPTQFKHEMKIPRKPLMEAIERVSITANERTKIIKLDFAPGEITLTSFAPDCGNAEEKIEMVYDGAPIQIAMNYEYLLDSLKAIESEEVKWCANAPLAPVCLKQPNDEAYQTQLIMPVQVK